jgi:ectoine hydroxylase-related dioxygenase (phytanoyl-CoA dioxygenase family)
MLGLERHAFELDNQGYTILNPTDVGPPEFIDRLRSAVIENARSKTGISVDLNADFSKISNIFGQAQFDSGLVLVDRIFEQALMHEKMLALITYMLGESCTLCHMSSMIKGAGPLHLPLHTDQNQSSGPPPYPPYAQVANATWALTDYGLDGGPLCMVPGSHLWNRPPTPEEATNLDLYTPIEAEAGSIIIWHGNTWHGALRRRGPGVRISLITYFTRWYMVPFDPLHIEVTQEMLDRNPPRFATLMGLDRVQPIPGTRGLATWSGLGDYSSDPHRMTAVKNGLFS